MSKYSVIIIAFLAFGLSSCHFGDSAEEMLSKRNDEEFDYTIRFSTGQSSGTRITLEDNGLGGIHSEWESSDGIAMFDVSGEAVFVTTNGSGRNALALNYKDHVSNDGSIDWAKFEGKGRAKKGDTDFEAGPFAMVFPLGAFSHENIEASQVKLNFDNQNGDLDFMRKAFFYAWGLANGKCENAEMVLTEAQASCSNKNNQWHGHAGGTESILLDNKMAIIRLSLVHCIVNGTDTIWQTLTDYLNEKGDQVVTRIEIENQLPGAFGLAQAVLSLKDGTVAHIDGVAPKINVISGDNGIRFNEIKRQNATDDGAGRKVAWGSTFYVSVPCLYTLLDIKPLIKVVVQNTKTKETYNLYGQLEEKILKEGDYYLTAPIKLVEEGVQLVEDTKVYLYYHSSFVWDVPIDVY